MYPVKCTLEFDVTTIKRGGTRNVLYKFILTLKIRMQLIIKAASLYIDN